MTYFIVVDKVDEANSTRPKGPLVLMCFSHSPSQNILQSLQKWREIVGKDSTINFDASCNSLAMFEGEQKWYNLLTLMFYRGIAHTCLFFWQSHPTPLWLSPTKVAIPTFHLMATACLIWFDIWYPISWCNNQLECGGRRLDVKGFGVWLAAGFESGAHFVWIMTIYYESGNSWTFCC